MFRKMRLLIGVLAIISISVFSVEAAKKEKGDDKPECMYCEKYKKLKDWPESERPAAFIHEAVDYPKGMFDPKHLKTVKTERLKFKFQI